MTKLIKVWDGSTWQTVGTAFPNGITLDGTQTLTNKTISGSNNTLTNIGNASLTNSSITINGSSVSLGGSTTVSGSSVELISETVASSASGLNLTGIPQTYSHLIFVWHGIQISDTGSGFSIRFQNDSGSNYASYANAFYETANDSVTNPTWFVGSSALATNLGGNRMFGYACNSTDVYRQSQGRLIIYNYSSTTRQKFWEVSYGYQRRDNNRFQGGNLMGTYLSLNAINEINVYRQDSTGTFSNSANTSIRLYGVK